MTAVPPTIAEQTTAAQTPELATAQQTTVERELSRLLIRALRLLGDAGATDAAATLAASAWSALRAAGRPGAERFTGLLHYLTLGHADNHEGDDMSAQILDVRREIPARRHELIFETWQGLPAGEAFVLVNDHDPKPLYYQFAAEHANQFTWDYEESGPQTWKVRIGRVA